MYLRNLTVSNFKNIRDADLCFSPRLNCLIGNNGAGKTNLLDALYYLSFTKSFFIPVDQMNILHQEKWFMLKGNYDRSGFDEEIICSFQDGQKKTIKRNSKGYKRMADHIGLLPLVMISPNDAVLITGGSEERRKFMDGVISQYDSEYLEDLLRYNRTLLQRNNLLKQMVHDNTLLYDVIEVYDEQMAITGRRIHAKRNVFINDLIPVFQHYYSSISGNAEKVGLSYQSDLREGNFPEMLKAVFKKDRQAQFTTTGIHKDELILTLSDYPIRKIGSQGQQKTFLVALKLAQFEFISKISGICPILLLDDIFDKLDRDRVEQIVKLAAGEQFGQIFITDTNREHLDLILHSVAEHYRIFRVENGRIFQEI